MSAPARPTSTTKTPSRSAKSAGRTHSKASVPQTDTPGADDGEDTSSEEESSASSKKKDEGPKPPSDLFVRGWGARRVPDTLLSYTPGEGVYSAAGKQLLDWAPVVTRNLVTRSPRGKATAQLVTLVIGDETATVPFADVADGSVWRETFPNVAGGHARQVRDALAAIVKQLAADLPMTSTIPAWTVEGRLQVPPADILPTGYLETAGDTEGYRKLLAECAKEPSVALVQGLAVGGLFVRPIMESRPSLQAYIVHMCGRSRRGKSTATRATAGIFGRPTISGVVRKWNVSASGLNAWLREMSLLTGFRDEISNARFRDTDYEAMVLSATEGAGRDTATKTNRSRESEGDWYGALISTGNKSILGRVANEAAAARVIELTTPITNDPKQAKVIDALAMAHYGHGLAALLESDWTPAKFEKALNTAAELLGLPENGGVEETLCWNLAFGIAGAKVLADLFDVQDLAAVATTAATTRFAELRMGLRDRGESPGARLRAALVGAVASSPGQFPSREKYVENLSLSFGVKDVAGWDLSDETHTADLAVISTRLRSIAEAGGVEDLKSAMDDLRAEGLLITRRDGKATNQLKVAGKNRPVYLFRHLFEDDDTETSGATGLPEPEQETASDQHEEAGSPGSPAVQEPLDYEKTGPDQGGSPNGSPGSPETGYRNTPSDQDGSPSSPSSPEKQTHGEDAVAAELAAWIAETEAAIQGADTAFFRSQRWTEMVAELQEGAEAGVFPLDEVARLRALHDARTRALASEAVIPAQRGSDLTESVRSPQAASRTHPRSPRGSAAPSTTPADDVLSAVGIDVVRGKLTASPAALPDGIATLPQLLEWAAGLNLGKVKPIPDNKRIRYDGLIYITAEAATALGLPDEAPGQKVNNKTNKLGAALRKAGWEWVESRGLTGYTSIYRGKGAAKASLRLCVLPWRQAEKEGNAPEFQELAGGDGPQAAALARRQNRIAAVGMPLLWTSAASGLELLGDHKPPRIHAKGDDGRWVTDESGAYVWTQNPASVEATPVPMPLPLLHHAHPGAAGRAPEDTVVEEDFMWSRGGATPVLSAAEASQPWAVTVDTVTSFAAVLENLRVPLGTYTPGGPTQLENTSSEVRRLYGFAKADLRGLPIEDGLPHFAGEGYEPDGPGWYALNTIYYAMREYGHDGHVSQTLITDRSGRLFDTWWPAIRDEYLRIMDSVGVPADLRGQAFLDAYATWKDRADEDTLAVQAALKMVYKGAIGKLGQGPSGDIDTWVANLAKQPWNRRDIRAYVLGEARTRTHRRYRLTRKYTGFSPFAVFRDCAVYALPEPTPLPLMSPDEDPETGKPIRGALRLGIRPGDVKPEGVAPLADLLDRCAQMVAENPAARPNPASITAHWNEED